MRTISYRTRQRVSKSLKITLIVLACLLALLIILVIYLGRFVVYSPDGTYLDFDRSTALDVQIPPQTEPKSDALPAVSIVYADPSSQKDETVLTGYYIDYDMLKQPARTIEAVKALPAPCTVLIDLKSGNGSFYYASNITGAKLADADLDMIEELLSYLKTNGFTMIARLKTFQDTAFAEANPDCGIRKKNTDLWVGGSNYWLQPDNETVISYLKQIARELSGKGFREIVFDDFYFPESGQIVYTSEKTRSELIADTARELLNFFSSSNIMISFGNPAFDFSVEDSHVFISGVDGSGVNTTVNSYPGLKDPAAQIVFLTGSRDTRFEGYQVLRPLY